MIRLSILASAAAFAGLTSLSAAAQPPDPNYQAQVRDNQARQQQYQQQVQSYDQKQQAYDAQRDAYARQQAAADQQRQLWLQVLQAYEARYGRGSYDEYATAHPDVTTTAVTPAGKVEQRGSTTVIETPGR